MTLRAGDRRGRALTWRNCDLELLCYFRVVYPGYVYVGVLVSARVCGRVENLDFFGWNQGFFLSLVHYVRENQ